jgi:hypothetical protein
MGAQEMAHRSARDAQLKAMRFPMRRFRPGQRELAEAMYRASKRGVCLLAQAPTGIGKPSAACSRCSRPAPSSVDKIFFLAAKTRGASWRSMRCR